MIFRAERAVAADGSVDWVVVEAESYDIHVEATAFLAGLTGRDCSPNTIRTYAGRTALYLSYCAAHGVNWAAPDLWALKAFQRWLVNDPLPARRRIRAGEPRFRSEATANAVLTTVCEFLRFGSTQGWVAASTVAMLGERKYLKFLPPGYDAGEGDRFRAVTVSRFRFGTVRHGVEELTADQLTSLLELAGNARDRFLISLLGCTGIRIGEALGLRREDMHLLADSQALGCLIKGPHIHVRRRRDNANGALAKARRSRSIPVTEVVIDHYSDYRYDRDRLDVDCDLVFVNCYRAPLGRPMSYDNAKDLFDRLARKAGFAARPHMSRHGAATRWIRAGVGRDVVQELLGHVSPASMQPYLHANDQEKRDAVERVAARRREGHV